MYSRRLTIGESFFVVSEDEAMEHLEKASEISRSLLNARESESEKLRLSLGELKKILYAKFGSSINLEDY
jgi:prefoldin subunit 4